MRIKKYINRLLLILIGILGFSISSTACKKTKKEDTKKIENLQKKEEGRVICMYGVPPSEFRNLEPQSNERKMDKKESQEKEPNVDDKKEK